MSDSDNDGFTTPIHGLIQRQSQQYSLRLDRQNALNRRRRRRRDEFENRGNPDGSPPRRRRRFEDIQINLMNLLPSSTPGSPTTVTEF